MIVSRCLFALLVAMFWALPALADQRDARLDPLFAQLLSTQDRAQAAVITGRIWGLWIEAKDEKIAVLMGIGGGAMAQGQYQVALRALNRIVKLAPGFAEGWNRRATLHFLMGNYPASVHDVEKTLALEPRHFGALSGLGLINMRLGRADQAIQAFRQALEVNPHLTGAKANLEGLLGERI